MKSKWAFVTATFLALGLLLLGILFVTDLSSTREPRPNALLVFAGFTNTPQRTEALFWFSRIFQNFFPLKGQPRGVRSPEEWPTR